MTTTTTNDSTYTLDSVSKLIPEAEAEHLELFRVDGSTEDLVASGARLSTEKILTDAVRWCGQVAAYMDTESAAAAPYSKAQLAVCWHHARKLKGMLVSRAQGSESVADARLAEQAEADAEEARGRAERSRLETILRTGAHKDERLVAEVDGAYGTAKDAAGVATSLRQLGSLGLRWLKEDGAPAKRLALVGGKQARFEAASTLAGSVEKAAEKARGAGVSGPVTQTQLDAQDGVVMEHLGRMRDAMRTARQDDPAAPTLVPIGTRSIFARRGKTSAAEQGTGDVG